MLLMCEAMFTVTKFRSQLFAMAHASELTIHGQPPKKKALQDDDTTVTTPANT